MFKLNQSEYLDKLHACWLGKNIGGTLGGPYEGNRKFLDVQGFVTSSNEPLPNDDLDLQLVWLNAMEQVGPAVLDANVLADYWLGWIPPHWNEYGIGKTNLQLGLLPPMSGEVDNEKWKTSNGAWIRSEIWASLAPGQPDVAVRYATMDAMVDHGVSEGVFAEIFTASLQSMAYVEKDIPTLIHMALAQIPDTSMTAKTIRLVIDCYRKGVPYQETREQVVAFNKELGWFQAPENLGFVAIGLLYGQGDFKKSMIYAINCGDDTDCTGATVGATLGIVGGTAGIPEDMKQHIGDRIVTISIGGNYSGWIPKTCQELTQRVFRLVPGVMAANKVPFMFTDEPTDYVPFERGVWEQLPSLDICTRSPYSYDVTNYRPLSVRVELNDTPRVAQQQERQVTLTFMYKSIFAEQRKLQMRLLLPETWSVGSYPRTIALDYPQPPHGIYGTAKAQFTVTVGEKIDAVNHIYAELITPGIPYPMIIPITMIG